jgi:hypothetical protein
LQVLATLLLESHAVSSTYGRSSASGKVTRTGPSAARSVSQRAFAESVYVSRLPHVVYE